MLGFLTTDEGFSWLSLELALYVQPIQYKCLQCLGVAGQLTSLHSLPFCQDRGAQQAHSEGERRGAIQGRRDSAAYIR